MPAPTCLTQLVKIHDAIIALAAGIQGWALIRTSTIERTLLILAGLLLVFPSLIEALAERIIRVDVDYSEWIGVLIGGAVLGKQWLTMRQAKTASITTKQ